MSKNKTKKTQTPITSLVPVKYTFTDAELADIARKAEQERSQIRQFEEQFDSIKSDYKAKIEGAEMRLNLYLDKAGDGFEMRPTEVVIVFNEPKRGRKTIYIVDRKQPDWRGEKASEEDMTVADFQVEMRFEQTIKTSGEPQKTDDDFVENENDNETE